MWIETVFSIYLPNTMFNITSQICIEKNCYQNIQTSYTWILAVPKINVMISVFYVAQYVRYYEYKGIGLIFEMVL